MSSVFKIYSPEDCDFYYDGELQGHIDGNSKKAFRFEVERKGVYSLEFINSEYQTELMMKVSIDADEEREVELDFSEVNEPMIREREERIIIAIEHDYEMGQRLPEEIISAISKNGIVTIPKGVRKIGRYAFYDCSSLTAITFPDSVIEIRTGAFCSCHSLTAVTIPDSVTKIEDYAFCDCSSLTAFYGKYASNDNRCLIKDGRLLAFAPYDITKYTVPNSVTIIGEGTFSNCFCLTTITIPNSVTKIEDYAFGECSSLTTITIPNSVTKIGNDAFSGCRSLISITIPDSVTIIGNDAFYNCSSLTSFYGKYASNDNRCLIKDDRLLAFASFDITKYTIPNSVTKIGNGAFSCCHSLISITIPDCVTEIERRAFSCCLSLTSVYCKATTPPNILERIFVFASRNIRIYVPKSEGSTVLEAYKSAESWKDYADIIEEYDFDNE